MKPSKSYFLKGFNIDLSIFHVQKLTNILQKNKPAGKFTKSVWFRCKGGPFRHMLNGWFWVAKMMGRIPSIQCRKKWKAVWNLVPICTCSHALFKQRIRLAAHIVWSNIGLDALHFGVACFSEPAGVCRDGVTSYAHFVKTLLGKLFFGLVVPVKMRMIPLSLLHNNMYGFADRNFRCNLQVLPGRCWSIRHKWLGKAK